MSDEDGLAGGSRQSLGQVPNRRRSLFPVIVLVVALFCLFIAIIASVYIPAMSSAIVILLGLLGLLQLPSVAARTEEIGRSLYNHLDKRWQDLADVVGLSWRRHWKQRWVVASILLSATIVGFVLHDFVLPRVLPQPVALKQMPSPTTTPVYTLRLPEGSSIGLSYGLVNFDTAGRLDGRLKDEAAQALIANNPTAAEGYWKLAIREDETDGEACIYQEDQNVSDSSSKYYVTIVVVVTLTGKDTNAINIGRSILQGACVAQKEYNSQRKLPSGLSVRLQVANIDDPTSHAFDVAKQIRQMAANDPTIIGVMGQLAGADDLVRELNNAGIPMLSSTALYSTLEARSLLSVAPSLEREAQVAATTAMKFTTQVGLLYDPTNSYSASLDRLFKSQFTAAGGTVAFENTYTSGAAADTLPDRVNSMMIGSSAPGLIYLAGNPEDASFLVPFVRQHWPAVRVMGGDVLYQYVHSSDARANFDGLLFTSFAFHDEWQWQGKVAKRPEFFNEYAQNFDAQKQHSGNPFTYRVPDGDAILAYDAASVLLQASTIIMTKLKQPPTFKDVGQTLQSGATFVGISGQVAFGSDGEPLEKAVVVLQPESEHIQLIDVQGRYP